MTVIVNFPAGAKPHHAASKDEARPHLTGVWIEPGDEPGHGFAFATDSYKLVKVPVTYDGPLPENNVLWLPVDAVKEATRRKSGGSVQVTEESYEPHPGDGRLMFRRQSWDREVKVPKQAELWPAQHKDDVEIGVNPQFLLECAKAMGSDAVALRVNPRTALRAIEVRPLRAKNADARAILMPMRVNL